jgi:hypothetical protein
MKKEQDENKQTTGWVIASTPWPGCPRNFNLVVVTESNDRAITKFKEFFHNESLEITAMFPVEIIYDDDKKIPTLN